MAANRVVSLVPSLTEALVAFGAGERVVGRTRYCLWPPRVVGKVPAVGGTKRADVRRVLEPDLVVAVREENTRKNINELEEAGVPVFVGAPEAITMLRELAGRIEAPRTEAVLNPIERVYALNR